MSHLVSLHSVGDVNGAGAHNYTPSPSAKPLSKTRLKITHIIAKIVGFFFLH